MREFTGKKFRTVEEWKTWHEGGAEYKKRSQTIEPVFGQIKTGKS